MSSERTTAAVPEAADRSDRDRPPLRRRPDERAEALRRIAALIRHHAADFVELEVLGEEIFGPVLVAMPFEDEADAIRLANATPYGLAAYVWTRDIGRAHRMAHAIDTAMCWINSENVRDLRTPFGGVELSGIGREGGDYAFEFYCDTEVVHVALGNHSIPRRGLVASARTGDVL